MPSISVFQSVSSFAHEAVLAQHIAMTTLTISSVLKLCGNCQRIDLSVFMPRAYLKFPDASGRYSGENVTLKAYVRKTNGSLINADHFNHLTYTRAGLKLGPLEAIVARKKCALFVTSSPQRSRSLTDENF
jgi:hypothetical protein